MSYGRFFEEFEVGQAFYARSAVVDKRESEREDRGIVTVETTAVNYFAIWALNVRR